MCSPNIQRRFCIYSEIIRQKVIHPNTFLIVYQPTKTYRLIACLATLSKVFLTSLYIVGFTNQIVFRCLEKDTYRTNKSFEDKVIQILIITKARKHARDPPWLSNTGQTSPKQGYQWAHKKDLCPPNFFFKKSLKSL